jgi:hypothetical protein
VTLRLLDGDAPPVHAFSACDRTTPVFTGISHLILELIMLSLHLVHSRFLDRHVAPERTLSPHDGAGVRAGAALPFDYVLSEALFDLADRFSATAVVARRSVPVGAAIPRFAAGNEVPGLLLMGGRVSGAGRGNQKCQHRDQRRCPHARLPHGTGIVRSSMSSQSTLGRRLATEEEEIPRYLLSCLSRGRGPGRTRTGEGRGQQRTLKAPRSGCRTPEIQMFGFLDVGIHRRSFLRRCQRPARSP